MYNLFCFVVFLLFSVMNVYVHSYISRNSYYLIRKMMISNNISHLLKNKIEKMVCYNYIPLALYESIKIKNMYKIKLKSKTQKEINAIAIDSLIDGVKKYDWKNDHHILTPYIKKYIRSYLIDNI